MNKPLKTLICSLFLVSTVSLYSQDITITQVDSSRLLTSQAVRLFLDFNLPPDEGEFERGKVTVSESADGTSYYGVRINKIEKQAVRDEGISFYILLDNSLSMWDNLDGQSETDPEKTRMTHAKRAILEFAESLSPLDRAGLAVFNTDFAVLREISADTSGIPAALDMVAKPPKDKGYTELYDSIFRSTMAFTQEKGRKVMLVLSDGEHFPPALSTNKTTSDDAIENAIKEEITCYVVNFGTPGDNKAPEIARKTGGLVFNAKNDRELSDIYTAIRNGILDEYALEYTAAMFPGEKRFVKVTYKTAKDELSTERYYYSGTVLGSQTKKPEFYYFAFLLIPIALWISLLLFKLEKASTKAGIEILYGGRGLQTKAFTLDSPKTVIGGNMNADITIAGNPSIKENAATIIFDKTREQYTITADSDLTVNNKPVKTKKLESGDVINISGTVVVFDEKQGK